MMLRTLLLVLLCLWVSGALSAQSDQKVELKMDLFKALAGGFNLGLEWIPAPHWGVELEGNYYQIKPHISQNINSGITDTLTYYNGQTEIVVPGSSAQLVPLVPHWEGIARIKYYLEKGKYGKGLHIGLHWYGHLQMKAEPEQTSTDRKDNFYDEYPAWTQLGFGGTVGYKALIKQRMIIEPGIDANLLGFDQEARRLDIGYWWDVLFVLKIGYRFGKLPSNGQ